MELRVLGAIELTVDGQLHLLSPTYRLLLAVLGADRRRVVSLDALADGLWGASVPATARSTLQTHVSKLRRAMGDSAGEYLVTRPPGYVLDLDPDQVDADVFERAVLDARAALAGAPRDAFEVIESALGRWRGAAFSEFADTPWASAEARRLEELRLVGLEIRNDARLGCGEPGSVIGELEGLVLQHPLRERFWEQLMMALHRSGRQAEALRAAHEFRRHLAEELGLEPSAGFRLVEQSILVEPPTAEHSTTPPSLTVPDTAAELFGRSDDLDTLSAVMGSTRMLTLTGPGGVGKSSLATAMVGRLAGGFADGARFVDLAAVHDGEEVVAAVAQSLDVERRAERSLAESIAEAMGDRSLLLVLDNCEHVVAAVGELTARLVRWCPEVRLLATSREPIGVVGETVRTISPLEVPVSTHDALDVLMRAPSVQVFVARAEQAAPSFELTERSAGVIAEICVQLDGLPLALELAAARMASMSPRELADRLHERFALLSGSSGRDPRHRTLSHLVQWSYELLTDKERLLLARLSVFAGGFDLDAAEQVCGVGELVPAEVAHLLAALVDKSMVVANRIEERVRYSQLETLRQFGAARLSEHADRDQVRRAHLQAFVERVELGEIALDSPEESMWAEGLDGELGNLRVAVRTAITLGDADSALRLVAASREWAFRRIRYELVDWAEAASRLDDAQQHALLPTVLAIVGYGNFVRGELDQAIDLATQAIATRERLGVASCGLPERVLGNAIFYQGDHRSAFGWIEQMVDGAQRAGANGRTAHALYMRSVAQTSVGDVAGGKKLADSALRAALECGSPTSLAQAAYASGLATASLDVGGAIEMLERSAALAASVGNRWMSAFALTEAMWLRAGRGEIETALRGYREVVEIWFHGGDWANQWLSLRHLAGIFAGLGRDEDAALLFGAVDAAGASAALPFAPDVADQLSDVAASLAGRLGVSAASEANRRGAMMRDEATVAAALRVIDELI